MSTYIYFLFPKDLLYDMQMLKEDNSRRTYTGWLYFFNTISTESYSRVLDLNVLFIDRTFAIICSYKNNYTTFLEYEPTVVIK